MHTLLSQVVWDHEVEGSGVIAWVYRSMSSGVKV